MRNSVKYRTLGRTGLEVSEIGFGCGNVGGLMIRGSEQEQIEAVSRALELGINYFDTAPLYGNGQSETNLGKVLTELMPTGPIVGLGLGFVRVAGLRANADSASGAVRSARLYGRRSGVPRFARQLGLAPRLTLAPTIALPASVAFAPHETRPSASLACARRPPRIDARARAREPAVFQQPANS